MQVTGKVWNYRGVEETVGEQELVGREVDDQVLVRMPRSKGQDKNSMDCHQVARRALG